MTSGDKRQMCAGAVVRDGAGRVLLVLRANDPARGQWSIPGGRLEPGESTRSAAAREVLEETGLVVEVGPMLLALEIGPYDVEDFAASVVGGSLRAGDDALEVGWFSPGELAALDLAPSLRAALPALGLDTD